MNAKEHEILATLETHVLWIREFIEKFPEECNKKYARKYVEKIQWLAIGGLITIIVQNFPIALAAMNSLL